MICEKCKANVSDTAKFCPKCGAKVKVRATLQETQTKKCPSCGAENLISAKFCKADGYNFQQTEKPLERPQEAKKPEDTILCPKCGTPYPITAKFCKKDGAPLQKAPPSGFEIKPPEEPEKEIKPEAIIEPKVGEVAVEAKAEEKPPEKPPEIEKPKDVLICPKCGTPYPITAKFCKKDGTPLKGDIKPFVLQPKAKIVTPPKAEIRKEAARKPLRAWIWVTFFVFFLIIAGAGSYLYLSGYISKSPDKIQEKINIELREKGLYNVFTEVNKNWVANVTGLVDNQTDKDKALNIVRGHKEIKDVADNIQIKPQPAEIEKDVNKALRDGGLGEIYAQVDDNFTATLHGSAKNQDEREKALNLARANKDVKDIKDNIQIIEEHVDHYLIALNINNDLSNSGLSNVYAKVNKDLIATLIGFVNNQAEKSKAISIARSQKQLRGIRDNIQVRMPDEPRVDPTNLKGDINRALRNAGLRGVTAEVNDNLEVTLKGSVGSEYEKDRAFEIVKTFSDKGVRRIRDIIFVGEQ